MVELDEKAHGPVDESSVVGQVTPWEPPAIMRSKTLSLVTAICGGWMIVIYVMLSVSGPVKPPAYYRKTVHSLPPPPRLKAIAYEPNSRLLTLDMATRVTEGSGKTQQDKSVNGTPLRINGVEYAHGIGTHADSEIVVPLNQEYNRFVAELGVDDEIRKSDYPTADGNVVFKLFADDKQIFDSGVVKHSTDPKPVDVSVAGAKVLRLTVDGAGNGTNCDRANWGAARLIK